VFKRIECKNSKFIEKLPTGKHSCKGIGRTMPNPAESLYIEDKLEIPFGNPVSSDIDDTALLYNEYPFFTYMIILLNFLVLKTIVKTIDLIIRSMVKTKCF